MKYTKEEIQKVITKNPNKNLLEIAEIIGINYTVLSAKVSEFGLVVKDGRIKRDKKIVELLADYLKGKEGIYSIKLVAEELELELSGVRSTLGVYPNEQLVVHTKFLKLQIKPLLDKAVKRLSIKEIATAMTLNEKSIRKYIKELGLQNHKKLSTFSNNKFLLKQYLKDNTYNGLDDIATALEIDRVTVWRIIIRNKWQKSYNKNLVRTTALSSY